MAIYQRIPRDGKLVARLFSVLAPEEKGRVSRLIWRERITRYMPVVFFWIAYDVPLFFTHRYYPRPLAGLAGFVVGLKLAGRGWWNRSRMTIVRAELLAMGRCPFCGFDLRGTSWRCPECGHRVGDVPQPRVIGA